MNKITFESLPIEDLVLKGIRDAEFLFCTPIQGKTLPLALAGKDVAGQAQTGTGKTAAFLIAVFNRLLKNKPLEPHRPGQKGPRALIIAPTRELARQIEKDARLLGSYCGLRILCIYGGVDYEKQRSQLKAGVDILIATPGRLIDYYKQKTFSLKMVEALVVDEADRMFDMGFIQDLRYVFRNTTPYHKRLTMLFSATLNYRVMELCYEHMNNPIKVDIEPEKTVVDEVKQVLYHVGQQEKFSLLLGLLKDEEGEKVLIFCNTKFESERLEQGLKYNGFDAGQISGDLHQRARERVLEKFQNGDLDILIATDVASRGLHVDNITHVINYDLPQDPEDYVHRIGRTARAGAKGTAISLCCEDFVQSLERVEAFLRHKIPVEWPGDEMFLKEKPGRPVVRRKSRAPMNKKPTNSRRPAKGRPRPRRSSSKSSGTRPSP